MSEKKKIIVVGAHPDDIEFMFGGTLAKLKELNGDAVEIYTYTICDGCMGSEELDYADLRATRWKENLEAAALIGATHDTCDIRDLEADIDRHIAKDIMVGQFRQIVPDIVLTHSPRDAYMPDHRVASWIVSDALFCAMLPNWDPNRRTGDIRTRKEKEADSYGYRYSRGKITPLPALYYGDIFPGYDIYGEKHKPTFFVDISSTMQTKREMLLKHVSQGAWLAAGHGDSDYVRTAVDWSSRHGKSAGVEYAEALLRHKGSPYNQDPRLEELLGDNVISI